MLNVFSVSIFIFLSNQNKFDSHLPNLYVYWNTQDNHKIG